MLFAFLLVSIWCLDGCHAQTSKIFQWQFTDSVSLQLPTCQTLPITVKPFNASNDTHGTPPFYMLAFAIGGVPTTTLIGTNESSLSWTVDHAVGTELMLSVVDANGSAGGIPPQLYTVVTGQSTTCINTFSIDFNVTANVTDAIQTCQPWGLRLRGGVKPYTITLAASNSPIVTNVTMGPDDDAFTYIERADPNTQLIAAFSDFTGRWASGTPIVNTQGSSDVNCTGLVSSSGLTVDLDAAAAAVQESKERKKRIILGVVIPVIVVLLIGVLGVVMYIRLKRGMKWGYGWKKSSSDSRESIDHYQDTPPVQYEDYGGGVMTINRFVATPSSLPRSLKSAQDSYTISSGVTNQTVDASSTVDVSSPSSISRPSFAAFPSSSVRNSKATKAGSQFDESTEPSNSVPEDRIPMQPSATLLAAGDDSGIPQQQTAPDEIVIQHQDGGSFQVRELPPPYVDRGEQRARG